MFIVEFLKVLLIIGISNIVLIISSIITYIAFITITPIRQLYKKDGIQWTLDLITTINDKLKQLA